MKEVFQILSDSKIRALAKQFFSPLAMVAPQGGREGQGSGF
jgi:hypothetical protein